MLVALLQRLVVLHLAALARGSLVNRKKVEDIRTKIVERGPRQQLQNYKKTSSVTAVNRRPAAPQSGGDSKRTYLRELLGGFGLPDANVRVVTSGQDKVGVGAKLDGEDPAGTQR